MKVVQCEKCQNAMRLQSETLTEEFWVCQNSACNKWFRCSSVIHQPNQDTTRSRFGIGNTLLSLFNKGLFRA
jgi:hypothetical protein